MVNTAFEDQVMHWHDNHPEQPLHFFSDRKQQEETEILDFNLRFSKINDNHFLNNLARCKAYASTAGFESICEAMYLGKPVMMVPAHIEQYCNMIDAGRAGAGIGNSCFNLDPLINFIHHYKPNPEFRKWDKSAEQKMIEQLT
jgi:uncharacterized protein (TIGR00661 family)